MLPRFHVIGTDTAVDGALITTPPCLLPLSNPLLFPVIISTFNMAESTSGATDKSVQVKLVLLGRFSIFLVVVLSRICKVILRCDRCNVNSRTLNLVNSFTLCRRSSCWKVVRRSTIRTWLLPFQCSLCLRLPSYRCQMSFSRTRSLQSVLLS